MKGKNKKGKHKLQQMAWGEERGKLVKARRGNRRDELR